MTLSHRASLLVLLAAATAGCTSISPPRSFSSAADEHHQPGVVVVGSCKDTDGANVTVDKALQCAAAMELEYAATAEAVARQQKNYRYGEIALGTVTLGLATFEAHVDTLKAIGLATGAAEATKASQQYNVRLAALDEGARRFRCVHEKGSKARDLQGQTEETLLRLDQLALVEPAANNAAKAKLTQATSLLKQVADIPEPAPLPGAIMDATRAVEIKAIRALRFSASAEDDIATLKKAIEDAVKLGKEKAASEESVNTATKDKSAAMRLNATLLIDTTAAYKQALIELAACPAS